MSEIGREEGERKGRGGGDVREIPQKNCGLYVQRTTLHRYHSISPCTRDHGSTGSDLCPKREEGDTPESVKGTGETVIGADILPSLQHTIVPRFTTILDGGSNKIPNLLDNEPFVNIGTIVRHSETTLLLPVSYTFVFVLFEGPTSLPPTTVHPCPVGGGSRGFVPSSVLFPYHCLPSFDKILSLY